MRCLAWLALLHVVAWSFTAAEEACENDGLAAIQVNRQEAELEGRPRARRRIRRRRFKPYPKKTTTPAPPPPPPPPCPPAPGKGCCTFNRVGFFLACQQDDPTCNPNVTEQVRFRVDALAVTGNGSIVVYTSRNRSSDGAPNLVGYADITNPAAPVARGTFPLGDDQPDDVATKGELALVIVDTTASSNNTNNGSLLVIDVATNMLLRTIVLGGEPDSIEVSPDEKFALISIENSGNFPEPPPGFLVQVNITDDDVNMWTTQEINLTGLDGLLFPEDPEPEGISIRGDNVAVVALQENNALVLVNVTDASVITSFTAGTVNVSSIDISEDRIIILNGTLTNVSREPDGVVWLGKKSDVFATADEGEFIGGSRSFSIFNETGSVVNTSGNLLDLIAVRLGHYPDDRSENKGNEPENVAYGKFLNCEMLFINSERSSLTFIFEVSDPENPEFLQALPAIRTPERGVALPSRSLYLSASEASDIPMDIRSGINIYECQYQQYPFLESADDMDGLPIPWGSIAGLTGEEDGTLWAVEGEFFRFPQILNIDGNAHPPLITEAIRITNSTGELIENLDPAGIDLTEDGFVIADRASESLLLLDSSGVLQETAPILNVPSEVSGVAFDEEIGYVVTELDGTVVVCNLTLTCNVSVFTYPLDAPASQEPGSMVVLKDIASLGNGTFLFLETDNVQGGFDAAVRRIYQATLPTGNASMPMGNETEVVLEKTLVEDFLLELKDLNGPVLVGFDSLAVTGNQTMYPDVQKLTLWVVNDNKGTDDTSGETQLLPFKTKFYD